MTKSKSSKKTEEPETTDVEQTVTNDTVLDDRQDDAAESDETNQSEAEIIEDTPKAEPSSLEEISSSDGPQTEPQVIVQKTGFVATLTGGVLAAGAGFLGAQFSSQSWPFEPGPSTDPLVVAQSAQEGVVALEDRLGAAEVLIAEQSSATPDLSEVEAQISDLGAILGELETRITALEDRPVAETPGPTVDMSEVEGEIEDLKGQVADLMAEANIAEASAAAAANAQLARAALARVMANMETGAPFAAALNELADAADITIPDALAANAANGIPALVSLQDDFDDAARDALSAARSAGADEAAGVGDRLTSFLRARTGARSVEPREGDDPDAVLSRVGASIKTGNIGDALAEAEALPETARSAMTQWLSSAETRQQALAAVDTLSQELNSN